jgi:hypothetical protein
MSTTITLPLPTHMSFELSHNPHKPNYYSISEYLDIYVGENATWADDDQRQKALDTDELWEARWFPATPIGVCMLVACDLSVLLSVLEGEP